MRDKKEEHEQRDREYQSSTHTYTQRETNTSHTSSVGVARRRAFAREFGASACVSFSCCPSFEDRLIVLENSKTLLKRASGFADAEGRRRRMSPNVGEFVQTFAQFCCAPIVSLPGLAAIAALRALKDSNAKKKGKMMIAQGINRTLKDSSTALGNGTNDINGNDGKNKNVLERFLKEVLQTLVVSIVSRRVFRDGSTDISVKGKDGIAENARSEYGKKKFRLVCVTGTYQEGFSNREMLNDDAFEGGEAVFVGYAMTRGTALHFDVKADSSSRDEKGEQKLRVLEDIDDDNAIDDCEIAPIVVLTNDRKDAVVYSVYAVSTETIVSNLSDSSFGRLMGLSSDTVAIDLAAPETSTSIRVAAQQNDGYAFALSMISYARPKRSSVCARPLYEKSDGTRVYIYNEEQLENAGITSESALVKLREMTLNGSKKVSSEEFVEKKPPVEEEKVNEEQEEASPIMNLLKITGFFEHKKSVVDDVVVTAPFGDSSNKSKKNINADDEKDDATNGGGFLASFLTPITIPSKKPAPKNDNNKTNKKVEEEEEEEEDDDENRATPEMILYPANVSSPWPDQTRDDDSDYVPDYEAEDYDFDDEPLSGGSSLMVTPTKEAVGGSLSFYESAATTPTHKARNENNNNKNIDKAPFGSVNAAVATPATVSTTSQCSSEFVYSVDENDSMDKSIIENMGLNNGENFKLEKRIKDQKLSLGGAVDCARLYTYVSEKINKAEENSTKTPTMDIKSSSKFSKRATRLVDSASCERALKYVQAFDVTDGGAFSKSRAVWFEGRRIRM